MAGMPLRRLLLVGTAVLALAYFTAPVPACPFCSMQGTTLTQDVNQASMVLFGTLANAKLDPNGDFGGGSTDLVIEGIIKKHEILGDQKVLTLPRYVPTDANNKAKFLIFCDVFKGKVDPYRGVPVQADSDIVKYLTGALATKDKPVSERLRFFFDYLDNPDTEIANDAYKEFGNSDYKDYRDMAKDLPPDKVAKWLLDPNTPAFRHGLYASMLGHCGTPKHAEVLKQMLDDPQKRMSTGVDGILAGYTMLQPKEGWAYLVGTLKDSSKEFMLRYAALRAVRFFWESRPDVIQPKELVDGVCQLLDQSDIADLAIEDLRKWGRWEVADRVLALQGKKSHDIPIVRRSILRYALSCPDQKAAAFVDEHRKRDPEMVKDTEELLKLEASTPAVKTGS
jgi:hypothetical protein